MTFNPDAWLAEGLANKNKLPDGVVLPEPEPDYEAWQDRLDAFCRAANINCTNKYFWTHAFTRGLIAAFAVPLRETNNDRD